MSINAQFHLNMQKFTLIEEALTFSALFPVVSDKFVYCSVCLRAWEVERSCSLFASVTVAVSNFLLPSTAPLHSQKDRERTEGSLYVCARGTWNHKGQLMSCPTWWPPCIAMRRVFSTFRGYRRAGEDDDEVFVCSPGYKVTTQTSKERTETRLDALWYFDNFTSLCSVSSVRLI